MHQLIQAAALVADSTAAEVADIPSDITYVVLLFALVVVPKALQRYRMPGAVTSLLLGVGAGMAGYFHASETLHLMSTFGIVALFLFAGLEINGHELRRNARLLVQHGAIWTVLLVVTVFVTIKILRFDWRVSTLIGLALLTPSTGFILSSLPAFGLDQAERDSVKSKAIGAELLSLLMLFIVLQSTSAAQMLTASAALLGIVVLIPYAFRFFAAVVAPYAPRSEFAFLLMVAVVCAFATRRLGVYYLVGAFFVGVAAQRFRSKLPAMSSEKMVDALEAFGSVFIPFYFFRAGTHIDARLLGWPALAAGVVLLALFVPLRVAATTLHRRLALGESRAQGTRVGIALTPTLVFTLVIGDILATRYAAPGYLVGGLILYTVVNTTLPAILLKTAPPEFEHPIVKDVALSASTMGEMERGR